MARSILDKIYPYKIKTWKSHLNIIGFFLLGCGCVAAFWSVEYSVLPWALAVLAFIVSKKLDWIGMKFFY